jgi:hypothetical protein
LQQKRRFADAGIARQQDRGPSGQPAADHTVEFVHAGGDARRGGYVVIEGFECGA